MSYICLLASEDGAVAASDSRLSHTLAKNVLRVRSDRTQKTFYSDGGKVIWAIAGVYKVGFTDLAGKVRRALRNDSLPLHVRLERCRYAMRRATAAYQRKFRRDGVSTLLYASYMDKRDPVIGLIKIVNGKVISDAVYPIPCFLQDGMNASLLSNPKDFLPLRNSTVRAMAAMAQTRVREAISHDRSKKAADRSYKDTVGGRIQIRVLHVRRE